MIDDILFALWFFLPAGVANMTPILVSRLPGLQKYNQPIDGGRKWRGVSIFGPHKTWRGLICGVAAGLITICLQQLMYNNFQWAIDVSNGLDYSSLPIVLLGILLGFGALSGDAIKSFFKRRTNLASGASWFPFDQFDYVAGGLLASLIVVSLKVDQYIWIIILWFFMHLIASYIGYHLRLKKQPI